MIEELLVCVRYLEKAGVPLATAQVQFSLLSRGPDQMTTQAVCRDLGITLIAYSPLGLGVPTPVPMPSAVIGSNIRLSRIAHLSAPPCVRWAFDMQRP